jgi:hypothetical protein
MPMDQHLASGLPTLGFSAEMVVYRINCRKMRYNWQLIFVSKRIPD